MDTSVPKIEVLIATFNGEKYIREQLLSIVYQTKKVDKIIVCDDCSVDDTVAIVKHTLEGIIEYELIVNQERLGYTRNFEKAISFSSGNYIMFSDQDDIWLPKKVETAYSRIILKRKLFVHHDCWLVNSNVTSNYGSKISRLNVKGELSRYIMGSTSIVKGDFARSLMPFPQGIVGHDNVLFEVLSIIGYGYLIPEVLMLYRRHDANTSGAIESSLKGKRRGFNLESPVSRYDRLRKYQILARHLLLYEELEQYIDVHILKHFLHEIDIRISLFKKSWWEVGILFKTKDQSFRKKLFLDWLWVRLG